MLLTKRGFDKMPPKVQKYPEDEPVTMSTLKFMMEQQKDFYRELLGQQSKNLKFRGFE